MAVYKRDIVDINLETGNIHRSFLKHSIGYMDQKADHFGIRAYRDGVPVDLTGVSVQGVFMPPQGSPIAITSGNIVDFNEAEVVLPQACYNYDGQFTLAIKLVDSTNSVTGTMRIVDGMVDNTHASGTVAPTEAVPTYQEIIAVYEDLVDALADVADYAENFAPAFAAGTANAAGSYVMYEGDLYLLPDGHTANTTWANTTKTQVTTGGEMVKLAQADSDLKSAIGGIKTDNLIDVIYSSNWKQGDYNSSVAYKVTQYISATGLVGKTMYMCGEGWDSNAEYIMTARFLNSGDTQISSAAINLNPNIWAYSSVTIPANTSKIAIVINTNVGSIHISPASICTQKPELYFGLTAIKSSSDFYYQYQGLIPDPFSPERITVSTNLFDSTSITSDTYWTGSGTGEAQGYYIADIPIKGGHRIVSSAINKDFSYYVSNYGYSTPSQRKKLTTYGYATVVGNYAYVDFVPDEDGHLLLTGNTNTKSDPSMVMVFEGSYIPNNYVPYGEIGIIYIGDQIIYPQEDKNIVIVASDGSGDFEKLKDAIDYASSRTNVTIYVQDGTYDLITEFGSAYFEAFDADTDEASGLQIGDGISIHFSAQAYVTANYTGNNQYVPSKFSPFNMKKDTNGFTLDGLNLVCSNCRYAIHDEDITSPTPYTNKFINCNIKIDNSGNTQWGAKQCIGGGLGKSGTIIIENCIFESVGAGNDYGIVSYHNGNGNSSKHVRNDLYIYGNYFKNGTVRLSYRGTNTDMSIGLVCNNSFTRIPYVEAEGSATTVNMEMRAWNNEIRN